MVKIFNYALRVEKREMLMMPKDAIPLRVVVKGDIPNLYAIVNPKEPNEPRIFRTVCSGEEFTLESKRYIDTFTIGDWFVGHLFELFESFAGKTAYDPISSRYADDFKEVGYGTTEAQA